MSTRGDFFAVDKRSWSKACDLGMQAAVAYLVLATGTGRDNHRTTWSKNAVEHYTGIGRKRARKAIDDLIGGRLVRRVKSGVRPKYVLPVCRQNVSSSSRRVFEKVRAGKKLRSSDEDWLPELLRTNWIHRHDDGAMEALEEAPPDWIWLPNALVRGLDESADAPAERVRQTSDVMALRLLVDLYHAHDLRDDGGVGRHVVRGPWEREQVGQQGEHVVWGFRYMCRLWVSWNDVTTCHQREHVSAKEKKQGITGATDLFKRLGTLRDLGLVEWVTYLCESQDTDAEVIHPFGGGYSDSLEDQIGLAANQAGLALLTEDQREYVARERLRVCPVRRHFAEATLVNIARLTYRPRTSVTAQWWEEHNTNGTKCLEKYRAIREGATSRGFKVAQ